MDDTLEPSPVKNDISKAPEDDDVETDALSPVKAKGKKRVMVLDSDSD